MAAALSDTQLRTIEQQLASHPEILQAIAENQKKIGGRMRYVSGGDPRYMETGKKLLAQYGIDFPDVEDYQILVDPQGQVQLKRQNWFQRNADWLVPVATIGTAGAGSYLAGGSSAAGTGGGYIANDVAATASSSLGGGAAAGGSVAGGAAAGGGIKSVLHDYLPAIIGGGAAVGGAAIAAHGQTEAAKIQAEAADKALKVQQEQYALQREDSAPYRALGQGALGNLGYLSGIDMPQSRITELSSTLPKQPYGTDATHPAPYVVPGARGPGGTQFPGAGQPDPYGTPGAPPTASLASLGQPGQPQMVQVRSPQGQVGMVPADQLQKALSMGGVQV